MSIFLKETLLFFENAHIIPNVEKIKNNRQNDFYFVLFMIVSKIIAIFAADLTTSLY